MVDDMIVLMHRHLHLNMYLFLRIVFRRSKYRPREVNARNAALDFVSARVEASNSGGVVYFADADNVYDLRLFEEIRGSTRGVSAFPVGLIGRLGVSSPVVVSADGDGDGGAAAVEGFTDPWFHFRKFPLDMAGFAFSARLLAETGARMQTKVGAEEDLFLQVIEREAPHKKGKPYHP